MLGLKLNHVSKRGHWTSVQLQMSSRDDTVYPKKYAHGFVVLCFVVVTQWFIMNSHEVFIHIHQSCFAGTGAIVRLPQCQWSKPDGYGKISQCITTPKHSKAKTVCIFLGIYCKSTKRQRSVSLLIRKQLVCPCGNVLGNRKYDICGRSNSVAHTWHQIIKTFEVRSLIHEVLTSKS